MTSTNPFAGLTGEQIRDTWQSCALAACHGRGKIGRVLLCVFAKEYAAALPLLLHTTFKGFKDISTPFLSGYASIMPSGRLVCDVTLSDATVRKTEIYESEGAFILDMRKLADQMKMSDTDRTEFFGVLQKWVVQDLRPERRARLAS